MTEDDAHAIAAFTAVALIGGAVVGAAAMFRHAAKTLRGLR